MNPAQIHRVRRSTISLAADLRDLARRAEGLVRLLVAVDMELQESAGARQETRLIDANTFTVHWRGRVCQLGYTIAFRLLTRLEIQRDEFVPHQRLFQDVWQGARSPSALRSAIADLRSRLARAGMRDLANAIDGHNHGHYGLMLRGLRLARRPD
jgi:DNA-binding response OmpR family regulator